MSRLRNFHITFRAYLRYERGTQWGVKSHLHFTTIEQHQGLNLKSQYLQKKVDLVLGHVKKAKQVKFYEAVKMQTLRLRSIKISHRFIKDL